MSPVLPYDLYYIKYTDDFQSFVDLSIIAVMVYASTEVYYGFIRPTDEVNLSVVWCAMVLFYGLLTLATISANYLRTAEASLLYVFAGLSFVLSLLVQLADTKYFDFNLKSAFRNMSQNTLELVQLAATSVKASTTDENVQVKLHSTNELMFTCFIALVSSLIGALLFFPSFRLARLHFLCLKYSQGSVVKRFLYYLNFFMPLIISFCWLKINTGRFFKSPPEPKTTSDEFISLVTSGDKTNMDYVRAVQSTVSATLVSLVFSSSLRIYLVVFVVVLRLALYRFYAQSYLNLSYELAAVLRRQTTRITNLQYIKTISSIYQYYGVVAAQYVLPLFVLLFLALLLKTLGDYSWCGEWSQCTQWADSVYEMTQSWRNTNATAASSGILRKFESETFNITQSHTALTKIFTPLVFRSIIGYFTFWTCTIWFTISCFGLLYYQYIDKQQIFFD